MALFFPVALAAAGLASLGFGLSRRDTVVLKDGSTVKTSPLSNWKPSPDATKTNPFPDGVKPPPLPIPVPPPSPEPPKVKRLAGVDVQAALASASVGQKVRVLWEYVEGYKDPSYIGEGGGDDLPLVWLAPDRSWGAVLWNQHPAYGVDDFEAGDVLYVRAGKNLGSST